MGATSNNLRLIPNDLAKSLAKEPVAPGQIAIAPQIELAVCHARSGSLTPL